MYLGKRMEAKKGPGQAGLDSLSSDSCTDFLFLFSPMMERTWPEIKRVALNSFMRRNFTLLYCIAMYRIEASSYPVCMVC